MGRPERLGYRPELDGVRAVAVLGVLLFHTRAWYPNLPDGGLLGVDLFFVLSGYLITSLLVGEHQTTGGIDRGSFYRRRALRILPALCFALILGAIITRALTTNGPGELPYPKAALAALLLAGNWFQYKLGVLGHSWSLSIELQYYIIWPVVVIAAMRRNVRPLRLAAALCVAALAIAGMRSVLYHTHDYRSALSSGLHAWSRIDGILIGSALALVLSSPQAATVKRLLRERGLAVAAVVAAFAIALRSTQINPTRYDSILLINVCFVVLIGHAVSDAHSPVSRVLRARPLCAIGRISYGLYLFHWPIFYLVRVKIESPALGIVLAYALAFTLATWSYLVIELPVLRLKRRASMHATVPRIEGAKRFVSPRNRPDSRRIRSGALRAGATL